jgi:hypothetical protein
LDGLRVDFKQACQVVHLLCESMGIRAIQRITGLHQETILNILETAGQKAAAFLDAKIRNVSAEVIQADEIYSFVYSKRQNTPEEDFERGEQFTFLSVDRRSKLIVNWLVGKRTRENAEQFFEDLKSRMAIHAPVHPLHAGYSKKLENHRHAVVLFVWHFNFVRKHSAHGKTPAESAGLTEKAFTIAELLESAN